MRRERFDIRVVDFVINRLKEYRKIQKQKVAELNARRFESKFSNNRIVFNLEDDLKMWLYKDSLLSRPIYEGFEQAETDFVKRVLKPGDTFMDIGANVGLFTMYASRAVGAGGKVFAFEPAQRTYSRLVENVELNSFSNVTCVHSALSDMEGRKEMHVSENGYDACNSFVMTREGKLTDIEEVEVTTLDHFIERSQIVAEKVRLLKIDVEGWEHKVIQGAVSFLASNSPILLMEFTDKNALAANFCCHQLHDLVMDMDFLWYDYDPERRALTPHQKRVAYPYNNLIALKRQVDPKSVLN